MYIRTAPSSINIRTHICINDCLCSFVFHLYPYKLTFSSSPLASSHVFQLICSLLAQQSDLNHLIGVSIWVPNRPWGPPDWLSNGWLYVGTNTMQPPPVRPHQPPAHTSHQRLVMFDCCLLQPAFLHFLVIPIICYSCMSPPFPLLLLVLSASSITAL